MAVSKLKLNVFFTCFFCFRKFGDLHEKYKFDAGRMRSTLILVDDKNLDNDNKVRLISKYK